MSLITEDGTGLSNSESYASVEFADGYLADRSADDFAAWSALSDTDKERALRQATDYLYQVYGQRWKGRRMLIHQALDWPRFDAIVDDFPVGYDSVPLQVQQACASLAFRASSGSLAPDIERRTASETVGPISVTYEKGAPPYTVYREIDNLLSRYLRVSNSGLLVRRA